MQSKIRVAILDDHPMTVEGYLSKLGKDPAIEITATMGVADLLEPVLQKSEVTVLILDVTVPISSENRNSYPILHVIPTLLDEHPNLNILVVSMRVERALIRGVMDAGANGYILKDDQNANLNFLEIVKLVAEGAYIIAEIGLNHNGDLDIAKKIIDAAVHAGLQFRCGEGILA